MKASSSTRPRSVRHHAVSGLAVQAIFSPIKPRPSSMSLRMPNWVVSIQAHILAGDDSRDRPGDRIAARTSPATGKLP